MNALILTLVAIICYAAYRYIRKRYDYFKDLDIPHLPPTFLLGNMAGPFMRKRHISDVMRDIYNFNPEAKYVGAFDFMSPAIVIRDLDLIKSVTIKNFDNFPDHRAFADVELDPLFGRNLFNIAGNKWKNVRNLLTPSFTSSKMKNMFELIVECAKNFVNYMSVIADDPKNVLAGKDLFTKYTNDVIATCAFGISVDTLKNPKNDFYVLGKSATSIDGPLAFKLMLGRAFPRLMKLLRVKFVNNRVASFFRNIISTTVSMRDEKGITRPDMLQLMMDARGKETKDLKVDITEMTAHAFSFFFGGFDTTSTQLCLIAHELAINPDVQKKLQNEIDDVLRETNGEPTYDAITGMPYLDAIFKESLRRHNQAVYLDRVCRVPFELPPSLPGGKPFTLKPGMTIWIPVTGIHNDPQYYENPRVFDPDRYYKKKISSNDVTNLGFGIGPRNCIGNRFAILETKILFFYLLSKFNLKPNDKTCNPLEYSLKHFSIVAKGGFWFSIEPRSDKQLL